jgi:hypothetical protein
LGKAKFPNGNALLGENIALWNAELMALEGGFGGTRFSTSIAPLVANKSLWIVASLVLDLLNLTKSSPDLYS